MLKTCNECGFTYETSAGWDVRKHNNRHKKWEAACARNGFRLLPHEEREQIKKDFYDTYENADASEKFEKAVAYLRQYFARSFSKCDFDSRKHPDFKEYVGYLLATEHFRDRFSGVYDELCKTYPPIQGAKNGGTMWTEMFPR